jgi:hypothetical protein
MLTKQGDFGGPSKISDRVMPMAPPVKGAPPIEFATPSALVCSLGDANKIDGKAMNGDEAGVKKQQDLINSLGGGSSKCKSATSAVLLGKGLRHSGGSGGDGGTIVSPSQTKVTLTS